MRETAIEAVKKAAKKAQKNFLQAKKTFTKVDDEPVTEIDIECEKIIKDVLSAKFPDYGFLGEESGNDKKDSPHKWIVDPIDGTVNYTRGIYLYGISIALAKDKDVILGVVYNPVFDEMLVAEKGKGAYLNDKKIRVSKVKNLSQSVIYATELYKSNKFVKNVYQEIKQFRITSSSAYETCLVAMGKIEGFIKITTHPWGFAAANLIVDEAGGKVTNFDNTPWNIDSTHTLTTNGYVHKQILNLLVK